MGLFIFMWIASIIECTVLEVSNDLIIIKDLADNGYKVNIKKMNKILEEFNQGGHKSSALWSLVIPVYNLFSLYYRILRMNKIRYSLIDKFRVFGVLEDMTDLEKEEYAKNPTKINAVVAPIKVDMRLKTASKITIKTANKNYDIIYDCDLENKKVHILKNDLNTKDINKLNLSDDEIKFLIYLLIKNNTNKTEYTYEELVTILSQSIKSLRLENVNDINEDSLTENISNIDEDINFEEKPIKLYKGNFKKD